MASRPLEVYNVTKRNPLDSVPFSVSYLEWAIGYLTMNNKVVIKSKKNKGTYFLGDLQRAKEYKDYKRLSEDEVIQEAIALMQLLAEDKMKSVPPPKKKRKKSILDTIEEDDFA